LLNDSKLVVKNDFIRITPDLNLNFWTGIGKAEINISQQGGYSRLIEYKYSYTRLFINFAVFFTFIIISVFFMKLEMEQKIEMLIFTGTIITSLHIFAFIIVWIRHKTVFSSVIGNIKNGLKN
jgi:hypothetical protein